MHLTTETNMKNAGFEISTNISGKKIENCINEAEKIHVKERITDALYLDLLKWVETTNKSAFPSEYETLMSGGTFIAKTGDFCGLNGNQIRTFEGLISTVNYYTYARLIKTIDNSITRFGFVNKNDEYSNRPDLKIKKAAENDALHIADIYLSDCILYIKSNKEKFPLFTRAGKQKNRLNFKIINSY
jgi:hypothetical protein